MSTPLNILCIETAMGATSVTLVKEVDQVFQCIINEKNKASESLHLLIQQLMKEQKTSFEELNAIAVSGGPGSYTGLRIGVASAKGLCYSLSIPLIHIETLKIMHAGFKRKNQQRFDYYIPMIDARRNDVYTAIIDANGNYVTLPEAQTLEKENYKDLCASSSVVFMGDGAEKFSNEIENLGSTLQKDLMPESIDMVRMAVQKWQDKDFQDIAYYEPFYYKEFYTPKI
jgi:tRNA threonylcarbamoyladenosine biosynthesis protein TsaB